MNSYSMPLAWMNRRINVVLLGAGGTGGEMLDELFRMHTLLIALGGEGLHVTAYDDDSVSTSNIGRQRFWHCDVGFNKAEVLISRINSFGGTEWQYERKKFTAKDINDFFLDTTHLLVTCVDSPSIRAKIGMKSKKLKKTSSEILWLDCGNDDHSGNVILGHLTKKDEHLPNVFELYPSLRTMKDNMEPSCSTEIALHRQDYGVNRSIAREGANLIWRLLRHGVINYHGSYIDIEQGTVSPLMIDEKVWATFAS